MICYDIAVPSQSLWSSPCLLVPKSDSSFRFCTDYRKVNKITKADSFPLPQVEDCVDRVGSANFVKIGPPEGLLASPSHSPCR